MQIHKYRNIHICSSRNREKRNTSARPWSLNESIENIEGDMPIASKRSSNHQTIRRQQPQQSRDPQDDDGYDDYVYYPYYSKATSENGHPYAEEPDQYEERPVQRYKNPSANSLGQQPRGWVEQRLVSWLHRIEPHDEDIGLFSLTNSVSRGCVQTAMSVSHFSFRYSMRYGNEGRFIFQRLRRTRWFFSLWMSLEWWSERSLVMFWTQNGVESVCLPIVTVVENRVSNSVGFHRSLSDFFIVHQFRQLRSQLTVCNWRLLSEIKVSALSFQLVAKSV